MAQKKAAKKAAKAAVAKAPAPTREQVEEIEQLEEQSEEERAKQFGQTEAQKKMTAYNKGEFQKIDPVTGEKRDQPLSGA